MTAYLRNALPPLPGAGASQGRQLSYHGGVYCNDKLLFSYRTDATSLSPNQMAVLQPSGGWTTYDGGRATQRAFLVYQGATFTAQHAGPPVVDVSVRSGQLLAVDSLGYLSVAHDTAIDKVADTNTDGGATNPFTPQVTFRAEDFQRPDLRKRMRNILVLLGGTGAASGKENSYALSEAGDGTTFTTTNLRNTAHTDGAARKMWNAIHHSLNRYFARSLKIVVTLYKGDGGKPGRIVALTQEFQEETLTSGAD
jgi:hypothetical protein